MTRCVEFYQKCEREGTDWCEKCPESTRLIENYLELLAEGQRRGIPKKTTIVGISEGTARLLFEKRNADIRDKLIDSVLGSLLSKKSPLDGLFLKKWTVGDVKRLTVQIRKNQLGCELSQQGQHCQLPDTVKLFCGDFREVCATLSANSVDAVITDPPYGKQYLPLYSDLVKTACFVLRDGGSLFVMTGQSFLPEVYRRLTENEELSYHWTVAMLLTFNNSNSIFPKKVLVAWKPVIWLIKGKFSGEWHHDVLGSHYPDVVESDEPDKTQDEWQQNPKGIRQLIEFYSKPNDLILDPMMGWGTTGIAAVETGRRFVGIDQVAENVNIAGGRINRVISAKSEN